MKTLEELDREYARDRARLVRAQVIAHALPVPPDMVHFASERNPWVNYKAATLTEAAALSEQFPDKIAYVNAKAVFRHIKPEELIDVRERDDTRYTAVETADGTPFIEAEHSGGYTTFKLTFFLRHAAQILRVSIEVERPPYQWIPRCVYNANDNYHTRPLRKDYPSVPGATTVKWGGSDNSARASYVWDCDSDFRAALTTLPEFKENDNG